MLHTPPPYSFANHVITVDGFSASGKGTLCKKLATHYHMKYLDTGTVYRATAFVVQQNGGSCTNEADALAAVETLHAAETAFDFRHKGNNQFATFMGETNIEEALRTPEVGSGAGQIATSHARVRSALRGLQQHFAQRFKATYGVILDGRDCGTVIYPKANLKFFCDAPLAVRAQRRFEEFKSQHLPTTLEETRSRLETRDAKDAVNTKILPESILVDMAKLNSTEAFEHAKAHLEKILA